MMGKGFVRGGSVLVMLSSLSGIEEDVVCSSPRSDNSAASCQDDEAEEVEEVKLPRPRHIQFVMVSAVDGRISFSKRSERF